MKIRQRLALRFTIVSALVMGAILVLVYVLTRGFVHADFQERLTQQSRIEALHFATPDMVDVVPRETFLLVNPVTSIYSGEGKLLYRRGSFEIPDTWVFFMKKNSAFNAERGAYTSVGRKYTFAGLTYIVFVSDKDLPGQHELDILSKAVVIGYILSLVLSYGTGLYFSGDALKPVKHVVKEVNQINQDNLSYRLKPATTDDTHDEIDELVITFNALLNRIESAFRTQKRFVQNASHELKTPLTAIMAEAELALARERPVEEYKRTLNVVMLETERLVRITQGLLTLARIEEGGHESEMEDTDIGGLVQSTLAIFALHHPDRKVVMRGEAPSGHVTGISALLQNALLNMLDNAVKYSASEIVLTFQSGKRNISIGVQDSGIGIPAHELNRIRSPLFRASNVSEIEGAGLGLSLVERIVNIHKGKLNIFSEEGTGTHCVIILPIERCR